ncbi:MULTISPECIES: transglutaminase-like cysteine peptidase [unclassified Marinobacter]|uniref:transglutaminase-like cysteine peptidase n=1 Tax=unclassified Marinobacter TaxID=83889 RepID=UPI0026E20CED|nr:MULTISPECIES: transglutaminase-like cysteine peptidase [unclassified Marinobacter]MDO6441349.1 transglutaminase-like cysteine peptidase [Marinobacter sp. 2_MG-2023]MDO6822472.1 transglutaminase-like cysteine peptidase [Marinobacter sp. 1_MG-2023]
MGIMMRKPNSKKVFRAILALYTAVCALLILPSRSSENPVGASIDFAQSRVQWHDHGYNSDVSTLDDWQALLQRIKPLDSKEKLRQVNEFVHKTLNYQLDSTLWKRDDYWATPLETLSRGMGDCEDFVIIQYISLLSAGITDDQLRLIYVRARIGGPASPITQAHMVLGYYPEPGAEPLLLDSLIEDILPANERTDLTPVFSFNSSELWAGGAGASAGSSTARLSPWRNVLNRIKSEGVSFNVSR